MKLRVSVSWFEIHEWWNCWWGKSWYPVIIHTSAWCIVLTIEESTKIPRRVSFFTSSRWLNSSSTHLIINRTTERSVVYSFHILTLSKSIDAQASCASYRQLTWHVPTKWSDFNRARWRNLVWSRHKNHRLQHSASFWKTMVTYHTTNYKWLLTRYLRSSWQRHWD